MTSDGPDAERRLAGDRRLGLRRADDDPQPNLVVAARMARERAIATFSDFKVGAALETASGRIITGCNLENATYGLTMCAERVAVFKALSEGHRSFKRIAVVADTDQPTTPCGACRQVLWEFGGNMEVILANLHVSRAAISSRNSCRIRSMRGLSSSHAAHHRMERRRGGHDRPAQAPRNGDVRHVQDGSTSGQSHQDDGDRGAPAIGVAAAMGLALGVKRARSQARRSSPRVLQIVRTDGRHAPHGREPVLGDRSHEARVCGGGHQRRVRRSDKSAPRAGSPRHSR
jgi:cytidine deaminase